MKLVENGKDVRLEPSMANPNIEGITRLLQFFEGRLGGFYDQTQDEFKIGAFNSSCRFAAAPHFADCKVPAVRPVPICGPLKPGFQLVPQRRTIAFASIAELSDRDMNASSL